MDLFTIPIKAVSVPIEERIESAVAVLLDLFLADMICVVPLSGGKDSTAVLMLTLWAAEKAIEQGKRPIVWILNADTGVESPVIWSHVRNELEKAKKYASAKGIQVQVGITKPSLSSSWLLRIVGGRAMPSFPENQADCSVDLKITPMQSYRKSLLKRIFIETKREAFTAVGTRLAESKARERRMQVRGDSATTPVRNKANELVLSPIAHWSDSDVWELLAMVRYGSLTSYTDTEDLFAIYQDAGPTSCAVINDEILEGSGNAKGGCSARSGCWCCVKVRVDASMENFLRKPEYAFMRGLNDLREFIAATQYDLSRRQWVGRTIEHGYICVRPDSYHPKMMRELLRYVLTLQAIENEEALRLGIKPRFQILDEAGLVGVDAMWSLNGFHTAFAAIQDYYDIFHKGVRYEIPKLEPFPKVEMPAPRFLYVGHWDEDAECDPTWTGLRDPLGESLWEWSKCMNTRELKDGRIVLDVNTEDHFEVDAESAALTLDLECERILNLRSTFMRVGGYTQAYKWWLARGTVSLAKGQVGRHDLTLRRTAFKERWGLCGPDYSLDDVFAASIPWHEAPREVQEAFIPASRLAEMRDKKEREFEESKQQLLFA